MSSLDSIFRHPELLTSEHPQSAMGQFHAKFWNKSSAGDKYPAALRDSSPTKDEVRFEKPFEDFHPDSYTLYLDVDSINQKNLLIRAEYIQVFDYCQKQYEASSSSYPLPSFVITGHPGIGKSFWMLYAAHRCAAEGRPFLWLFQEDYFIFVDEGVYLLPFDWHPGDFIGHLWAFVDADNHKEGVPPKVCAHNTKLVVFFVTPADEDRWKTMSRTTSSAVIIMKPCNRDELRKLAQMYHVSEEKTLKRYDHFGPNLRICLEIDPGKLSAHADRLEGIVGRLTLDEFQMIIHRSRVFLLYPNADMVCTVDRCCHDLSGSCVPSVAASSVYIQTRLANKFRLKCGDSSRKMYDMVELYLIFERDNALRKTSRLFYQSAWLSGLAYFRQPLVALSRLILGNQQGEYTYWHSPRNQTSGIPCDFGSVEEEDTLSFEISSCTQEYSDKGLDSLLPDVMYIPKAHNREALEPFIYCNGKLYILQFTSGGDHGVTSGVMNLAHQFHFPNKSEWCIVFVVPSNATLDVEIAHLDLMQVDLRSSVLPSEALWNPPASLI
ncbi:hypothetical protein CPB84DRAFT_1446752 [Gymnopilus junonius]|uniref:Crinkler (CRN) family protein n=1 Tax=Gymnopilus junonius TaxID=109634 RepID=A0A9P5TTM1_GYMJU|nr:hypothetical protein CPB84DRAFT_1446752 [Gymnopilus junonius]